MKSIDRQYLDLARTIAENNAKDFQHRIGCVVVDKKNRVISIGFNKRKTHPVQGQLASKYGKKGQIFLHAEIDALVKTRKKPHKIYVARVKRNGKDGLAKPCPICQAAIESAGIKKVFYTEDEE